MSRLNRPAENWPGLRCDYGARPLLQRDLPREEVVDRANRLTLHVQADVRIDVEGDGHAGMAEHLRNHLGMNTLLQ